MPENMNLKIGVPGKSEAGSNTKRPWTLQQVISWIQLKGLDAKVTEILIKKAQSYPHHSLGTFVRSFKSHLVKAREQANSGR